MWGWGVTAQFLPGILDTNLCKIKHAFIPLAHSNPNRVRNGQCGLAHSNPAWARYLAPFQYKIKHRIKNHCKYSVRVITRMSDQSVHLAKWMSALEQVTVRSCQRIRPVKGALSQVTSSTGNKMLHDQMTWNYVPFHVLCEWH